MLHLEGAIAGLESAMIDTGSAKGTDKQLSKKGKHK
jgi:hypothetical protein